jgi:hypothetical protein
MKEKQKSELELLQDIRDAAATDEDRKKAQTAIDKYFLGELTSKRGKKEKKKKIYIMEEDDYDFFE